MRSIVFAMMVGGCATAAATPADCVEIGAGSAVEIGAATIGDDYALTVTAQSASATSWGDPGNEALVIEVAGAHGLIGHLLLHQGAAKFDYSMHVGALDPTERLTMKLSPLSAAKAVQKATVCHVQLVAVSKLGAAVAEGIKNAPSFRWPAQKAFNDVPMIVGWSKARHDYQTLMTNEDGGTAEICGGGATGMQSEIARWSRSMDLEMHYSYGGTPRWERCTGTVETTKTPIRMEGAHPILYWGDGHNRLFESRGGYGETCGKGKPEMPDGKLAGWNTQNPSSALADDAGKVIILRPLPVDLDALGYAEFGGRREALADHYGPWIYRVSSLELAKEHKIDNAKTFGMSRYLYVDVQVSNVGGKGDSYCSLTVSGGFKVRVTTTKGAVINSPQITASYAGGGKHEWKRVAIALPDGVTAADVDHFTFDAYDKNGIYLTGIGDAFIPVSDGTANGAKLDYVRKGTKTIADYVDDDSSGCKNGASSGGPGSGSYKCVGGQVDIAR